MIINLRQRSKKIANPNPAVNDEWVTFDNATEVRYSKRPRITDKMGFKSLFQGVDPNASSFFMLKDPAECDETECYHYNVLSYRDVRTNMRHEIIFDTILFLMSDTGHTLFKVEG